MEAFTLLKYWRGGSASAAASIPIPPPPSSLHSRQTTTIVTSDISQDNAAALVETDDEEDAAGGDDGSFFDLEFSVGDDAADDDGNCQGDCTDDGDREFDFTLSSSSSGSGSNDPGELASTDIALSPSDEMFSQLVPMMDSSDAFNPKSQRIPVSLLKSATKFRVFLLGFKKSKANNNNPVAQGGKIVSELKSTDSAGDAAAQESEDDESGKQSRLFTVKFKVEEVPNASLFTRDSSSSSSSKSSSSKDNANTTTSPAAATSAASAAASDERQRFSKEALQKYLKKVKPLYVRVSKRYGEKLRFSSSGQLTLTSSAVNKAGGDSTPQQQQQQQQQQHAPTLKSSPSVSTMSSTEKIQPEAAEKSELVHQATNTTKHVGAKQGNLQAGLRVVCKHLGKSRSASSAVAAAPSPPASASSQRRDDSLLQQQDGIQSAILHCKRSFNASRDSEYSRSASDSSPEKSSDDGETSSG